MSMLHSSDWFDEDEEPHFLESFKGMLATQSVSRLVQEHLVAGSCQTMSDQVYFELRSMVASQFRVHPNEIIVVGSGKLGFSIKPKRRYGAFHRGSDYDIAIISSDLFDNFWRLAFHYTKRYNIWKDTDEFYNYMIRGWMRPDMLPTQDFDERIKWDVFFDELSTLSKFNRRRMKAGLYKSWEHLHSYQTVCVDQCKAEIERTNRGQEA